jgi:hypothetical protein
VIGAMLVGERVIGRIQNRSLRPCSNGVAPIGKNFARINELGERKIGTAFENARDFKNADITTRM